MAASCRGRVVDLEEHAAQYIDEAREAVDSISEDELREEVEAGDVAVVDVKGMDYPGVAYPGGGFDAWRSAGDPVESVEPPEPFG